MNLFHVLLSVALVGASKVITLTNKNYVSLVGPVTSSNIDSVLVLFNDAEVIATMKETKQIYLYLNTPGGSVFDGYRLIQHIRTLQAQNVSVDCIGQNFMSMGFAIMQACSNRFIMTNSLGMQHPMSTLMYGSIQTIRSELDMIEFMYEDLSQLQYTRMNIPQNTFNDKIIRDWWMFGQSLIHNNAADESVLVQCSPDVSNMFIRRTEKILGHTFALEYNKCPLINTIHTEEKNMTSYFDTNMYRTNFRTILRDTLSY
jgi:ATP-dependent Clp protease protease subunit